MWEVLVNYIPQCKNKDIILWCQIADSLDTGFNILLLKNDDGIYGDWYILENSTSAFARTNRQSPFGFELSELPKEINNIVSALFNYWFVQFEFPINGKPYKSSGGEMEYNSLLDMEIPKNWKVKNIQKVCDVVDCLHSKKPENVFESDDCYLLQLENICQDGSIDVSSKYHISLMDYKTWTAKIEVQEGDFVVTNAGRTGAIGIIPHGVRCGIGRKDSS